MNTKNASSQDVQISFRASPELKRLARIEAAKKDMSLNEWIKTLITDAIPKES